MEVVEVAYNRVASNLTEIANSPPVADDLRLIIPYIFIDVWAIIDALDKFRILYQKFPNMEYSVNSEMVPLAELLKSFRNIRNVQDHLYANAQNIAATGEGAFGTLEWMTVFVDPIPSCWKCIIRPGTLDRELDFRTESMTIILNDVTTNITLKIAGHVGNISMLISQLRLRIKNLEDSLGKAIKSNGLENSPVSSDFFSRQGFVIGSYE